MAQQMEAEVLFLDPDDLDPGVAALTELGFEVEVLDWVDEYLDDYSDAIWIKARIASELDQHAFLDWVHDIVEPLQGDVVEAGFAPPPQAA